MSKIILKSLTEFKTYCKSFNITQIQLQPKKHQNMRGEYLHEVSAKHDVFDILIDEPVAFKEKRKPIEEGYKLSEI
jgi:hypothetical protein